METRLYGAISSERGLAPPRSRSSAPDASRISRGGRSSRGSRTRSRQVQCRRSVRYALYSPLRRAQLLCRLAQWNGTYQPGSLESKSPCRVRPRRVSPDRMPQGLRHWLSAHFNNAVPSAIVDLGLLVCPRRHAPEMKCWHQPKHLRSFPLTTATRGCRSGSLRGCRLPPSPRPPRPVEREARPTAQARSRQAFFARGCRNPCRQHCSQARMLERAAPRASEADLIAPRPRARYGPQTRTGPCLMRRLHEADDPFVRATLEPNSSYTISIDEPDAFNTAPLADF